MQGHQPDHLLSSVPAGTQNSNPGLVGTIRAANTGLRLLQRTESVAKSRDGLTSRRVWSVT